MVPIDIQVSRSKVKPILYMLGKGGISVLQTSIFLFGGGGLANVFLVFKVGNCIFHC